MEGGGVVNTVNSGGMLVADTVRLEIKLKQEGTSSHCWCFSVWEVIVLPISPIAY